MDRRSTRQSREHAWQSMEWETISLLHGLSWEITCLRILPFPQGQGPMSKVNVSDVLMVGSFKSKNQKYAYEDWLSS